jgi:organic hydroperoxide reductase OsmC/OhrA
MKPLPHHYDVNAAADHEGHVELSSYGMRPVISAPPAEFGGPGDLWSPETLLVGAVADCFVLTFKSIAAAARLKWNNIHCDATGTLDRADDGVRFTGILLRVLLDIPEESDPKRARHLLEKAEKVCLVTNSLKFKPSVEFDVVVENEHQLLAT